MVHLNMRQLLKLLFIFNFPHYYLIIHLFIYFVKEDAPKLSNLVSSIYTFILLISNSKVNGCSYSPLTFFLYELLGEVRGMDKNYSKFPVPSAD